MLKVGLTGGIASGKSTLCRLFSDLGIDIIDADIIARQLVKPNQPCLNNIIRSFGDKFLLQNGELDRAQLRQYIFSNPKAKQQLEDILHPNIREQLILQSDKASSPYCIISIPLIVEANMIDLVDSVLVIDIAAKEQLKRLCQRDDISLSQANAIIASQCSSAQRKSIADDIIDNNKNPKYLNLAVAQLHKKYLDLANVAL